MATNPDNSPVEEIHEKLFTIAEDKIIQILQLISRADLEARRIATDPLRPRLVRMRPPRPMTAMRIFGEPFEDLLDHASRYERTAKRISRESITLAWRFLMATPARDAASKVEASLRGDISDEAYREARLEFWKECAERLDAEVAGNPAPLKALPTMTRRDVYRQLGDMTQLLRHSDLVLMMHEDLPPKPIAELIDEDVAVVVALLQQSAARGSQVIELVLRVLMARMARPGDLLTILAKNDIGLPSAEQAILTREMGAQASAHVVQQAERASQLPSSDPLNIIEQIADIAERLESLEVDNLKGVTVIDEQLNAARNTLRETVIRDIVKGAEPEIASALERAAGTAGDPIDREESLQKAEDHLIALRRAERHGETLKIEKELAGTLDKVSGQIESQAEKAIDDFMDMPKHERDIDQAKEVLYTSVRMLELAAGSNRADTLRKRALASLEGAGTNKSRAPSPTAELEDPRDDA